MNSPANQFWDFKSKKGHVSFIIPVRAPLEKLRVFETVWQIALFPREQRGRIRKTHFPSPPITAWFCGPNQEIAGPLFQFPKPILFFFWITDLKFTLVHLWPPHLIFLLNFDGNAYPMPFNDYFHSNRPFYGNQFGDWCSNQKGLISHLCFP